MKSIQLNIPFYQEILDKLEDISSKMELMSEKSPLENTWLSNQEVAKLLRVTPRTLQNYRDQGIIPFSQVGPKIYYKASDIQKHLEDHYVKSSYQKGDAA